MYLSSHNKDFIDPKKGEYLILAGSPPDFYIDDQAKTIEEAIICSSSCSISNTIVKIVKVDIRECEY